MTSALVPANLAEHIVSFGQALRRAGVPVDAGRIGLAQEAVMAVGIASRGDFRAALECVLISQQGDRPVFDDLFEAFFRVPDTAGDLLAALSAPSHPVTARALRSRVADALAAQGLGFAQAASASNAASRAGLSASDVERIRQADFRQLSGDEYQLVQKLASRLLIRLPSHAARRTRLSRKGSRPDWPSYFRELARVGDDALPTLMHSPRQVPLPLLILVDTSGSMERYARMLLSFLHAGTARLRHRHVFAFATRLTDLSRAFEESDAETMLARASQTMGDFAGGTRLGAALHTLHREHARHLVGRRTVVMLISDGLDTGDSAELGRELAWLKRHCAQLLWMNPLLRFEGFAPTARGPAILDKYADHRLAIHNLARLEELAGAIESLLARR